jgi:hypothetical protein
METVDTFLNAIFVAKFHDCSALGLSESIFENFDKHDLEKKA